jgi:hypothetical protein
MPPDLVWNTYQDERAMTWFEATWHGYDLWCQGDARGEVWRFGFLAPATRGHDRQPSGSTILYTTDSEQAKAALWAQVLAHLAGHSR